ncbi:MAG TPA: hypothetical protein VED37_06440, partial [Ktedonobacteraceae bacterium]|nr:hypothetical protein [Ktedonobacteraceae bacterium]
MEEPTAASNSSIGTQRTTAKLPSEDLTNNPDTFHGEDTHHDLPEDRPANLELIIIEGFQVGRGVARIDPADMGRLGCQPGDIIMISGARTTAAKVVPTAHIDRGQQIIQMDSQVRQNSASGL